MFNDEKKARKKNDLDSQKSFKLASLETKNLAQMGS